MTLQQLQYVLAAARAGSFSAAAEALHLAQPSLSEQIRRLEAELGVELFARVGRGVVLTEAGRRLVPHAERVIAEVDAAAVAVREVRQVLTGTVSFGTFGEAPSRWLAEIAEAVLAAHPAVRVRLVGQNSSEVADAVRDGELEAGLITLPVDDRGLLVRPMVRSEVRYLTSVAERAHGPVTIERLARAPLVFDAARFGLDDPLRRQLVERAQRAGLRIEPLVEVEDARTALELVDRGVGDYLASTSWMVGRARELHAVALQPKLYDTFAFVTRRGAALSPAARSVMSIVEARMAWLGEPV